MDLQRFCDIIFGFFDAKSTKDTDVCLGLLKEVYTPNNKMKYIHITSKKGLAREILMELFDLHVAQGNHVKLKKTIIENIYALHGF